MPHTSNTVTFLCSKHNSKEQRPSWEANKPSDSQDYSPHFMKPAGLLMHSQAPAACPVPTPSKNHPVHACPSHFLKINFNISLPAVCTTPVFHYSSKRLATLQGLDTKFYGMSTLHFQWTVKNKHSNRSTVRPIITLRQSCSSFHLCGQNGQNWVCMQATFNSLLREEKEWVYVHKIIHIISLPFFLYICNNKCTDKTVPGKVATTHTEDGHKQDT